MKYNSFEDILSHIEDKETVLILQFFKAEKFSSLIKRVLERNFNSDKEVINYLKEEVIGSLKSDYENLKEKISELRKEGKDVSHSQLKIMSIPLKIRIFAVSFSKKDFDKIMGLFEQVNKNLPVSQ
jgi:hypothetical protein